MKSFPTICTILPSNTAVSPDLYTKLYFLQKKLQVNSEGIFADSVTESLQQMNAVEQNVCKKKMMDVAEKMGIKLDKLMKNDPARVSGRYRQVVLQEKPTTLNTSSDMLEYLLKSVPRFKGCSMEDAVIGFREVVGLVRDKDVLLLLDALIAMRDEYVDFSTRCLKAIWLPVSNVDSERFFSTYAMVLTDKRTNLSLTNLEVLSSFTYENKRLCQ